MKKLLIGTTALVAGGLIAGSAMAAEVDVAPEIIDDGFTVTWSGYVRAGFYAGDTSCSTANPLVPCNAPTNAPLIAVQSNDSAVPVSGELQLFAEQTLANGLRVGGEIDLDIDNGTGSAVQIDELWLFIDGNFGQIRLGQKEGALDSIGGGGKPGWGAFNGSTDGPDMAPLAGIGGVAIGSRGSIEDISGDQAKVTYLSPTFAGINFAVSFSPDPQGQFATGRSLALNGNAGAGVNQYLNEWSAAANATQTYGDYTMRIAGGFTSAEAENNNATTGDVDIWKIAGSIKSMYGGIGGWISERDFDTLVTTTNGTIVGTTTWGITANIISGDYTFGGGYTNAQDDVFSAVGVNNTDNELDLWGVGVSRSLGTGVEVGANATFEDYTGTFDSNTATRGTNADGWLAGVYAAIAF